jgi:hypothetical protein
MTKENFKPGDVVKCEFKEGEIIAVWANSVHYLPFEYLYLKPNGEWLFFTTDEGDGSIGWPNARALTPEERGEDND